MDAQIVNLNVGSALFTTTLATLRSQPGSTLSAMFAGDHSDLRWGLPLPAAAALLSVCAGSSTMAVYEVHLC
jgi:hypothetical protein